MTKRQKQKTNNQTCKKQNKTEKNTQCINEKK